MTANNKCLKGYFVWSIPFLLLFACNSSSTTVSEKTDPQNCEWYVAYNEKNTEQNKSNKLDVYALRFYSNGAYTLCADLLFEQGTWKFDTQKKLMVLTPSVKSDEVSERYLLDQTLINNKIKFSFYHQYPPDPQSPDEVIEVVSITNHSTFDPYSIESNLWRQKPLQAETIDKLRKRVVAYLSFLNALYHHAKDNHIENPGGTWYPQPVKFYSNKVSMAYANELYDWNNCFYNEQQAVEGYQLISGALMKVKIEGKDDLSRNINCVEQLLKEVNK